MFHQRSHVQRSENGAHAEEKNQSVETDTDARIEAVITAVFCMFKKFSGDMQGI